MSWQLVAMLGLEEQHSMDPVHARLDPCRTVLEVLLSPLLLPLWALQGRGWLESALVPRWGYQDEGASVL